MKSDLDLSKLETHGFGPRTTMFWGTLAFITLEGTGFALAIGTYLYLMSINPQWPLGAPPPGLLPGSLITFVMLASVVPNYFVKNWTRAENLPLVQAGLVLMSMLGILILVIRWFEFPQLKVSWDANAYGSILWFLLGLHTVHLLTDVADTIVLTVLMFTRHVTGKRFSDTEDNGVYWDFVVLSWLPIYLLLYWVPRW